VNKSRSLYKFIKFIIMLAQYEIRHEETDVDIILIIIIIIKFDNSINCDFPL